MRFERKPTARVGKIKFNRDLKFDGVLNEAYCIFDCQESWRDEVLDHYAGSSRKD